MKNILAENMLRFGVKNLSSTSKQTIQFLIEQEDEQQDTTKQEPDPNRIGADDAQPYMSLSTDPAVLDTITPRIKAAGKTTPNADIENELRSAHGTSYDDFIKNLNKGTDTAINWYLKLNQKNRNLMIGQFKEYLQSNPGKDTYGITINRGRPTKETIAAEKKSPILIPFIVDIAGDNVFVDNSSALTSRMKEAIDTSIQDAIKRKTELEVDGIKLNLKLNNLTGAASASRFRNSEQAANLTFKQLSELRLQTAIKYLLEQLKTQLKCDLSNYTTTKGGGYNGDGTSGPNPPVGNFVPTDGTFNNIVNNPTAEVRNQFGPPLANKAAYNNFKFLLLTADINGLTVIPPEDEPKVLVYQNYLVSFGSGDIVKLKRKHANMDQGGMDLKRKVKNKALKCSFTTDAQGTTKLVQIAK